MPSLNFTAIAKTPALKQTLTTQAPADWQQLLCNKLVSDDKSSLSSNLDRHIGSGSAYKHKEQLTICLKLIYLALDNQDSLPSTIERIKANIGDGITACSEGYHDRIQAIVQSLNSPHNLNHLCAIYRASIVDKVARINNNNVHSYNDYFLVAYQANFGVSPLNINDPYTGLENREDISKKITDSFIESYTFFKVLNFAYEQIRAGLIEQELINDKDNICSGKHGQAKDYIANYYTHKKNDDVELSDIYYQTDDHNRVNWCRIKADLFDSVYNIGHFNIPEQEQDLFGYVKSIVITESEMLSLDNNMFLDIDSVFNNLSDVITFIKFTNNLNTMQKNVLLEHMSTAKPFEYDQTIFILKQLDLESSRLLFNSLEKTLIVTVNTGKDLSNLLDYVIEADLLSEQFTKKIHPKIKYIGYQALEYIAVNNPKHSEQIISILHNKGINIDQTLVTPNRSTALGIAAIFGHKSLVDVLINNYNANINYIRPDGNTPLILACINHRTEIAKSLISKLNIEQIGHNNNDGDTALTLAVKNQHQDITKLLVDILTPEQINHQYNNYRWTALILAASQGNINLVEILIQKLNPEQIGHPDANSWTALTLAVQYSHEEVIRLLVDRLNPEQINHQYHALGWTSLMSAVSGSKTKIVEILIDKLNTEQINHKIHAGQTALSLAKKYKYTDIVKIIENKLKDLKTNEQYANFSTESLPSYQATQTNTHANSDGNSPKNIMRFILGEHFSPPPHS